MKPHGGIFLGRHNGRNLIDRSGENVLIVGPTRCKKGVGVMMPTLLDGWYGAATIHDPKGELWDNTANKRAKHGHCLKFDPTDRNSVRINLFDLIDPDSAVPDVQNYMLNFTDGMPANHWTLAGRELMTGGMLHLLYHAPPHEKTFAGLRRLIQKGDDGLAEIIQANAHPVAARIARSILGHGDSEGLGGEEKSNYRQSVYQSASVMLQMFDDEIMDYLTSATEISISQLVCGPYPASLYLSPPDDDAARTRPYLKCLIVAIRRALMRHEKTDRYGELKEHRMLLAMDEFLDIKVHDLAEALTKCVSYGVTMLLVAQGFKLIELSDEQQGAGILNNCSTHVIYKPNADTEAYRIEKMLGKVTVMEEHESVSSQRMALSWSSKNTSHREVEKTVLPMAELLKWPRGKWSIVMGHGKPIKCDIINSHMEPRFTSKVLPPPPIRDRDGNLLDLPHDRFVSPWKDKVGTPVVIERKPKEPKEKKAAAAKKPIDPIKQAVEQGTPPMVIT